MGSSTSAIALFARTGLSLLVVLGLLWLAARGLQKRQTGGFTRPRRTTPIEVVSRQGLARGMQIAVVRTCGRTLILGITQSGVQVLADDGAPILVEAEAAAAPSESATKALQPGWKPVLDALRERTVRRA